MPKRVDPRAVRTKGAIKQAFRELVCETHPDKVTVSELTARAGINRKTFYLHFESVEALFADEISCLMDEFFEQCETTPDEPEDIDGHAVRFFRFMAEQPAWVERLVCTPSYFTFGEKLYFEQMSRYRSVGNPFAWMGDGSKRLTARFIRYTALEFYRGWVADGKRIPADEAAQLLAHLTCHGVDGLMR